MTLSNRLREYNGWRRGADMQQPDPELITELIETAACRLEVLEREHAEFFEKWHEERRKREKIEFVYKDLLDAVRALNQ